MTTTTTKSVAPTSPSSALTKFVVASRYMPVYLAMLLDLGREDVESVEEIASRIRRALEHTTPDRLAVSPDCGLKYLPRGRAQAKLAAMVSAANLVRSEL